MDSLQEILYTLRCNKLRTILTAFGVFWGILMLVLLLGAGRGFQNGVMAGFGNNVMDFIMVYPGTTAVAYQGLGVGRGIQLREDDVAAIQHQIPGIRSMSPAVNMGSVQVIHDRKTGEFELMGVADEFFMIKTAIDFNHGRVMSSLDEKEIRKIALIGNTVAERLFNDDRPIGKTIQVKGVVLTVVGVFTDKDNNGRASNRVYIPISTYQKVFGGGNQIGEIWLRPTAVTDGFELEKRVVELLKQRHQIAPEDRRAINAFNMAEPAKAVAGLFWAINGFIWFVGLGTLTAGIVGVSNIMIITVKERSREIGIRKALGATPFNIVGTLLLESILVTMLAGYLGLVMGVALLELVALGLRSAGAELPFFKSPEIDFQMAITAIMLLVGVGALAGLFPALKAAKIMPIEAMRAN